MSHTLGCGDLKAVFDCIHKLEPLVENAAEIAGVVVVVSLGLVAWVPTSKPQSNRWKLSNWGWMS